MYIILLMVSVFFFFCIDFELIVGVLFLKDCLGLFLILLDLFDRKEGVDICSWFLYGLIFLLLGLLIVFVKSVKICVLFFLFCEVLGIVIFGIL